MIYLDKSTDSILPYGLNDTPFAAVYEALQAVAGDVWAVDPAVYRAGIAWGYYLTHNPEKLIELAAGRQYIVNILLGEQIPLIKDTQTTAELVELLTLWRDYSPTFHKLEALYKPYAADVDIRPITDPYAQSILPVSDIKNAFYVLLRDTDPARPLLLGEAALIAERATPMGSRPIVIGQVASDPIEVHADMAWGDICFYVENFDLPDPPPIIPDTTPKGYIVVDSTGAIQHSIDQDSMFIHQIQHSSEMGNFYFTSNGASETNNTSLESGIDVPLYNADGTAADDLLYDDAYVSIYTQANGNMFKPDGVGDSIMLQNGRLCLNPDGDRLALSMLAEKESYLEIDVGMRWYNNQWNSVTLDDWWYAGFLNQTDADAATAFGLPPQVNDRVAFGNLPFDPSYKYTILRIYGSVVDGHGADVLSYDLNNFYIENSNKYPSYGFLNQCLFEFVNALTSQARAYRLRIEKHIPRLERFTAYPSASKTPVSISSGSSVTLYDSDGNAISVGNDLRYDMVAYYMSAGGKKYPYTDAGLVCVNFWEDSYIKLNNNSGNTMTIQRIEYTVCEKNDADDPNVMEILLGLRWRSDHWGAENFDYSSGNYWYGGILSAEDQQRLIDFGCTISKQNTQQVGQYGQITYDDTNFSYEPIAFYADQAGTIENPFDISQFYCWEQSVGWFTVWCNTRYQATSIVWKLRIRKLS